MTEINTFKLGDIIKDKLNNKRYRIIGFYSNSMILCQLDISKLALIEFPILTICQLLKSSDLELIVDKPFVFDETALSEKAFKDYSRKKEMIQKIMKIYDSDLMLLQGKSKKPELETIQLEYGYSDATFRRILIKYLQSGLKDSALVDAKAFGINKGKQYNYTKKPGRPSEYLGKTGVILDSKTISYFDEALKDYKSGRAKTITSAFDAMNINHYAEVTIINGIYSTKLKPASERPTYEQLRRYINNHITEQERAIIKTSAAEVRNDRRLLYSDELNGVLGPGDMAEIDACEVDVSLVSSADRNRTIGRPVVYCMIDVYTRVILAVSIAFDNNSNLGITNLFLNLADNKVDYCKRFGINLLDPKTWPSNIIPRRIRLDRGSEATSDNFARICNELGIENNTVTGATGSLKGIVEQLFHQLHSAQNEALENNGLIEKRYDSNHHKEATLTIEEYTRIVINHVISHNQKYFDGYQLTKDMIEKKIEPVPVKLWEYGISKYAMPKSIPDINQYMFNLMTPIKAKVSRKGIAYKNLIYDNLSDVQLSIAKFRAGNKREPFDCRIDLRDVGAVYYIRDGKLMKAPLSETVTGNAEYSGYTMKEYEDYRKIKGTMDAKGRVRNEEISAFSRSVNKQIVASASKPTYSDDKNMREAREVEKQRVSASNSIKIEASNSKELEKAKTAEIAAPDDQNKAEIAIIDNEKKGESKTQKQRTSEEVLAEDFGWED